jgi:WD40 repeat protein
LLLRLILALLLAAVLAGCDNPGAAKSQPAPETEVAAESSSQKLTDSRPPVFASSASPSDPIAVLEHTAEVMSIDIAPDGLRLISGDRDGNVRIWDLKGLTGPTPLSETPSRILGQLPYETGKVGWVSGAEQAVAEGLDSTVRLWDIDSGRQLRIFERHSPPAVFAISPTGTSLATVGKGQIRIWEVSSGREIQTLPAHAHFTQALAFSPDGEMLASGGDRGLVLLREVAGGQKRLQIEHPEKSLLQILFSPDGQVLATIGFGRGTDAPLRLWSAETGERIDELRVSGADIQSFAFSSDGQIVAGAGSDHKLHIWDLSAYKKLASISTGKGSPRQLVIGPGKVLCLAAGKRVRLWNLAALAESPPDASSQLAVVEVPADPATGITHVRNAGELLGAIGPGRTIELAPGIYNLSKVRWRDLPHVTWRPVANGEEIVFHDLADLTLRGDGKSSTIIVTEHRTAGVLSFERVDGLRLENLELRHAAGERDCLGGVLSLVEVSRVIIDGCQLLGSGSEGLTLRKVEKMRFVNSAIRQCSAAIMTVFDSKDLTFENSRMEDNGALYDPAFRFDHSAQIRFQNVIIAGNTASPSLFSLRSSQPVKIADSEIVGNKADQLVDAINALQITNTRMAGNSFASPLPSGSRFAGVDIAIGTAFRKNRSIRVGNSLFSGFDTRRTKAGDRVDIVDTRGLLCRARITEISADGSLLSVAQDTCRTASDTVEPDGAVEVFVLHPSVPQRHRSTSAASIDMGALEAALPSEVKERLENSRAKAPEYLGGRTAYGIESIGDADGDGTLDLMNLSLACRPGAEYTCHTALVFENGSWLEARRIGHP